MKIPFSDLSLRHKKNETEFSNIFRDCMTTNQFILGEQAALFESEFSSFTGANYALGVANGSDALRLALIVKKLPVGGNIILAANTYFAAPAAIVHSGLVPKFFDVNLDSRLPKNENIVDSIDENTVGLIKSHLFGEADTTNDFNLPTINDCSQAHGTLMEGRHVGFGQTSTFSFYPGKNLGAFGDAGLITTNDSAEVEILSALRNQGTLSDRYLHEIVGFNSRMDSIQAGILRIKLKELATENKRRNEITRIYKRNLVNQNQTIKLFSSNENTYSTYHLFQVFLDGHDLDTVQKKLLEKGVASGRHYPIPLHLQPAFNFLGYGKGDFPNAEKLSQQSLTLPNYPEMTDAQVDFVCEKLLEVLKDS